MKKQDVKVGETYRCKVSGSVADVRITGENPHGGWDAVNTLTSRKVRIKSAQRLRGKSPKRPAKRKKIVSLGEYEAEGKGQKKPKDGAAAATEAPGKKRGGITEATKADAVNAAMQAVAAEKKKRTSGLDAAAQVLAEAKGPLTTKEMVERMLAKGLWQTGGKTPAATIYAAIIREIATKGDGTRFRKVARGKFELADGKGGK
jgi:hypothetical protein